VPASTDPLPRAGPVPSPPPAALVVSLGRCCSESRAGARVDAIVLHATETPDRPGTEDLRRLARYFTRSRKSSQAADDAEGNSSRMVADALMAYHATYWNQATLGLEQVGYSSFTRAQWLARRRQLATTARWVAFWARRYRVPIRRCVVAGIRYNRRERVVAGTIVRRGVCSHAQLDPRNRDDPGSGYPWSVVLRRARAIARAARG
jgi:N-acetyl-anhydromuramyl-L-alanine amidase AmpD